MSKIVYLTDIVDDVENAIESNGETVAVQDILDAFHTRTYGPLLLLCSALAISPLGAIPTVPTMLGVLILLLGSQLVAGKKSPWLPKLIRTRTFSKDKVERALHAIKPWFARFQKLVKPRLTFLVKPPNTSIIGAICVILALFIPPLEIVPLAVIIPATGVALLSLALTSHDGICALCGYGFAAATMAIAVESIL
ncbi:MAG: exopolysaccharide biosynthesis protein [Bdellovibrionales bacterium]|nr:exopolysaccharide biosynthesis protein [Bdellovibrionales bacterium]